MDTPSGAADASAADALALFTAIASLHGMSFATLSEAVDAYLAVLMRSLRVRSAFIANFRTENLHVVDARDTNGSGVQRGDIVPYEDTFCQYVRATGAPVVITDTSQDARVQNIIMRIDATIGSYIGVPLIFRDGTIRGTLCALDPQAQAFQPYHTDAMRIVARHLSLLYENDHQTQAFDTEAEHRFSAERARDDQSAIMKIVVHDLRNPLSCVQGQIELLQQEFLGPLLPEQRTMLESTYHTILFANRLITDLMDASAVETRTLSILSHQFDPCLLGQSVLDTYQFLAKARGLTLHLECVAPLPAMVGDIDRLRQILLNYVGNALRYTAEGTITLRIEVVDSEIQFAVYDTGPGVSSAAQQDIWTIYTRKSNEGQGLGLGLYIVKRLAEAMGGTIGMQSSVGRGSMFWVRLPIHGQAPYKTSWMPPAG